MKYTGVVIADEHFGALDPEELYEEHFMDFFHYLDNLGSLDFIIIAGDFFDHNLYLNDVTTSWAIKCMNDIVSYAKVYGAKVRIVYGTESHECGQYVIFNQYIDDPNIDFKVIYHVEEEELFPDLKVLYIPEEHIYDKEEYYKEYFKKEKYYDYIFGHGSIQEVMTYLKLPKKTEKVRKRTPVFTTQELSYPCKGQVYFGHYHIMTNINDKIFYVGSFSRWIHGEENPKGFFYIETDLKKYSNEFVENVGANKYKTIIYGYDHRVFTSMEFMRAEMENVKKMISDEIYQYIRLIFNIPEKYENPEALINFIRNEFKFEDHIKTEINNGYIDKQKKVDREKLDNLSDKYGVIFDRTVPVEEKYAFFIKDKKGVTMDPDKIATYLNTNDIIQLKV